MSITLNSVIQQTCFIKNLRLLNDNNNEINLKQLLYIAI